MKTQADIQLFLAACLEWSASQPAIQAVALVGSYARNAASETSDIDLVLLCSDPSQYLQDTRWAARFGTVDRMQIEDYGPLTSLRVWYAGGPEVEYGFTTPFWIQSPLDAGTQEVIAGGFQILYERSRLLSANLDGIG